MTTFRLLVEDKQEGPWNMAVDQTLLDSMEHPEARPVVRLYGFQPPTLSLGRFQNATEVLDRDAVNRDGLCVVRRPTGGQAVLHDGELTYAVCMGRSHREPFSKREVYRFVAQLLVYALGRMGLVVDVAGARQGDTHDPDCFRTTGEYEIGGAGRKLVGSAQTVTRWGALQHGSILLDDSNRRIATYLKAAPPGAQRSTSVLDLLGRVVAYDAFRDELAQHLEEKTGAQRDALREEERAAAAKAVAQRYGRESWTYDARG